MNTSGPNVDLNRIQLFRLVIELGSFSKAAIRLGVPKSNISRNISDLETQLKTQLIYRTTRQFQPTEAGRQLYLESKDALASLEQIVAKIARGKEEISGTIRFTAPEDLHSILSPIIADFIKQHPRIRIDCHLTNAKLKLVQDGIDVGIRAGVEVDNTSFIVRKLGDVQIGIVASAAFLERVAPITSIEDLAGVPCVSFRPLGKPEAWNLVSKHKKKSVEVNPVCVVDNINALRDLVMLHAGVAPLPLSIYRNELLSGQLLRLLPEWSFPAPPLQILMPPHREKSAKVKIFTDHIYHQVRNALSWG